MDAADQTDKFLRGLSFFANLPEPIIQAFTKNGRMCRYSKQRNIFMQGDEADRLFVVLSGWVKLYRETTEGDEAVIAIFTRGDVFGEAAIFDGAGYPFSAEAAEETRILEIPSDILRDQARANHEVMAMIMNYMTR